MSGVLAHLPETPVKEQWEWLTDILIATDGTEQRISLRGDTPRVTQKARYLFVKRADMVRFSNLLATCSNILWVPEWQYSTRTTAETLSGASRLYYDPALTDIRAGEWVMVDDLVYSVSETFSDGATVTTALPATLPKFSLVAPVAEAILEDGSSFSRLAVNEVGESSLSVTYNRRRLQLPRPGTSSPLLLWAGVPVLKVRPLADNNIEETITANQVIVDNKISAISLIDKWQYSRIGGARQFKTERIPVEANCGLDHLKNLDYWRWFLSYCRGAARKFWMPTFRPDFTLAESPLANASSLLFKEIEYAETVFSQFPTHRTLYLKTGAGDHFCTVSSVAIESGNCRATITPSLPAGVGWNVIEEVSYLLPMRLANDVVELDHYGLYSILNLNVRTAE